MTTRHIRHWLRAHFGAVMDRYPAVTAWLMARLTLGKFTGLPLTVLAGLFVANVMILSEVAENLVNSEPMVLVDHWFTKLLFDARSSSASRFFYGVTWFGSVYATVGLAVLGSVLLFWQHKRRHVLVLWLLMVGVGLTVQVGKRTFSRERPVEVAYYAETGFSFPSGHSATAMTLYGLLGYWLVRGRKRIRNRVLVGTGTIALILSVGFSRIYLGVHFLSDVLGGYLLGICWLIVGIVLTEWQWKLPENKRRRVAPQNQ